MMLQEDNRMKTIIGINRNKKVTNEYACNKHILATGMSGAGKSTAIRNCAVQQITMNRKILQINYHGDESIRNFISETEISYKRIDVSKTGIPVHLFSSFEGEQEDNKTIINRTVSLLSKTVDLTFFQRNAVQKAIESILENHNSLCQGIEAVHRSLEEQHTTGAKQAIEKLYPFFDSNVLYDGNMFDDKYNVIEIDLNGFEYEFQNILMNFLMDYIFRLAEKGIFREQGLTLMIDEVQNLTYKPNSPINLLLNESRKHNVQLLMATPSLNKRGMEVLTQCGMCLFFKPIAKDTKKVAEMIDAKDVKRYFQRLSVLKKGEFLAVGGFNNRINHDEPKRLSTYFPQKISKSTTKMDISV